MFIIFFTETKRILSSGNGILTEYENKLYLGSDIICKDLSICGRKYIADQELEQNEGGFIHDADYYEEVTPAPSLQDQIDAIVELM